MPAYIAYQNASGTYTLINSLFDTICEILTYNSLSKTFLSTIRPLWRLFIIVKCAVMLHNVLLNVYIRFDNISFFVVPYRGYCSHIPPVYSSRGIILLFLSRYAILIAQSSIRNKRVNNKLDIRYFLCPFQKQRAFFPHSKVNNELSYELVYRSWLVNEKYWYSILAKFCIILRVVRKTTRGYQISRALFILSSF